MSFFLSLPEGICFSAAARYVRGAIAREKELKHWTREQKIELIEKANPTWVDLFPTLLEPVEPQSIKADSLRE